MLPNEDVVEYLLSKIKRRWPEAHCPFHIEVIGGQNTTRVEVRVWNNEGIHFTIETAPEEYLASREKSPTVAAVLHAVEATVTEARNNTR